MLDAASRDELARRVAERSFGLGPLEPLLADAAVDEIMVSGAGRVWVERAGRLAETDVRFESEAALRHAIERILAPLGRRVDEAEPLCDARLPDGSRVNVVIPPLALEDVEILAARPAAPGSREDAGPRVAATLRVSAAQAVYLAAAGTFARDIRLLPRAPGDRRRHGAMVVGEGLR